MVKNTLKLGLMIMLAIIILPTGPSDLFIIPVIVKMIGWTGYIILSLILIIYLYNNIEGKDLGAKLNNIKKELKL